METPHRLEKPLMVFDGDCFFCRRWIGLWQIYTGSAVDYLSSKENHGRFPEITEERCQRSVQFLEKDGKVYEGAEAVFRALTYAPGKGFWFALYQRIGFFRSLAEMFYRSIASNRVFFSKLTQMLWGSRLEPSRYGTAAWVFIKGLALIYAAAFLSLAPQVLGLTGSRGILPIQNYLRLFHEQYGFWSFLQFPTLFWIYSGDPALVGLCWAGALLSTAVFLGWIAPAPGFFGLWLFYLSLVNAGQEFFAFQWDALLLETGFLAIFFSTWRRGFRFTEEPPKAFRFLLGWLLFRLMYFSGILKLRSGDPVWHNLTALTFHYETQPLPTYAAWFMHQLPPFFHQTSALFMFGVELVLPFLILAPRKLRHVSAWLMISLQVLIIATGNYCFFNLLAILLCVLLFDDFAWPQGLLRQLSALPLPAQKRRWPAPVTAGIIFLSLFMTWDQIPRIFINVNLSGPAWVESIRMSIRPFRSFNQYGLFMVMTTERPEIVIEGSNNRVTWLPYEFKYKPGDLKRAPSLNVPHQPRLDWQMWFAALGTLQENPWFYRFCGRLLEGSPSVLKLLKHNPFPDDPPQFLRAVIYDYRFSTPQEKRGTGAWWVRESRAPYMPVLSRRES